MKELFIGTLRKMPSLLIEKTDRGNCFSVIGGLAGVSSLLLPVFVKSSPDGASYIKLYEYIRVFLLTGSGFTPLVITFILSVVLSFVSIVTGGFKFTAAAALLILVAVWIFLFISHIPVADCRAAVYTLSAALVLQATGYFVRI